jgi:hypothetical protein
MQRESLTMVLFTLDYLGGIKIDPINMLHLSLSLEGIKIEPINGLLFPLSLEGIKIEAINTVCYSFN